jgi:hypothetical protein
METLVRRHAMNIDALTGAAAIVALATLILLLVKVIAPEGVVIDDLFRRPTDMDWPRGVQEEEPTPWRLDLLDRSGHPHHGA